MIAQKINRHLACVMFILFTTQCRQVQPSPDSSVSGTKEPPCSLASGVRGLTNPQNSNPGNEKKFYQLAREEAASPSSVDWKNIATDVERFKQTLSSEACTKMGLRCRLALISKNAKKALKTVSYAPYSHTLKIREIGGQERILIKGFGAEPFVDPRQPGGVFRRYQNAYVWLFRSHAGDLHPGFILSKLKGQAPERMSSIMFESPKRGGSAGSIEQLYGRVQVFHQALIEEGFLRQIDRGFNDDALQTLYIVDRNKISSLADNGRLKKYAEQLFGKDTAPSFMTIVKGLLEERANPIILPNSKGKFEITAENLKAMRRDLPFVSIQGGVVQCSDHHRIMAAHDLGMAIEVGVFHGFVSFN